MNQKTEYLVCTRCITYNHAHFIEETLNGFAMQRIESPVVFTVIDDASPDGEQDVLREWISNNLLMDEDSIVCHKVMPYGELFFARHNKQSNMYFAILLLAENHFQSGKSKLKSQYIAEWVNNSKYIALCEGDDYWIDPLKLKKQTDYLELHNDCVLCGTNGLVIWDEGILPPSYFNNVYESRELTANDIIGKWALPTPSLVYRKELILDWPEWTRAIVSGDQILLLLALYRGSVYCLKDLTCVYRKNNNNKTSLSNMFKKGLSKQTEQHLRLYKEYDEYTNHVFQPLIGEVINKLEKELAERLSRERFYAVYNRSKILALFKYPCVFVKLAIEKLKS